MQPPSPTKVPPPLTLVGPQPTFEVSRDAVVDTKARIDHEPVFYVGYFSQHEQSVQALLK